MWVIMYGVMVMKKTIAILAMTFCLTVSNFVGVSAALKTSSWATQYVSAAESLGIMPSSFGDKDLTQYISRVDFCELMYNTINKISTKNSVKVTYTARDSHFYDTDNNAVIALYRMGIISGKTSTKFAPNDYITREEAAAILYRAVNYLELKKFSNTNRFTDSRQISGWAYDSVDAICGMNIMSGMGDGTFNPSGYYTFEQAITTMIRLASSVPNESREKIENDIYYLYNDYFFWIENGEGEVKFKLSSDRYTGLNFYSNGEEILVFATLKNGTSTDAYSIASGKKLFNIPAHVYGTYADKRIIVSKQTDGKTLFGVYNFDGKQVLPIEYNWDYLYSNGYVGTQNAWQ